LVVSGRVQGVGFRAFVEAAARGADLQGWVRNLPDGRVEMLVEGEPGAVDRFEATIRQGPPLARVSSVDVEAKPAGHLSGFSIR